MVLKLQARGGGEGGGGEEHGGSACRFLVN